MIKNTSGQTIGAQLASATDGSNFTGAVTVYVTGDAGTQAIGTVGSGLCTHEGRGYHTYTPSAAETAYDLIAFTFTGTGAVSVTVQVFTITAAQAAALAVAGSAVAITARALCTDAAIELGYLDAVETLTAEDAAFILRRLNLLLDEWNADRDTVYADVFTTYALTPSLSPHTIGPTGTFVVTQRPVTIDGANLLLSSSIRTPVDLYDRDWWFSRPIPSTSSQPTGLYYDPTWPNGSLYFWPVPSAADSVELMTRVLLTGLTLNTTFSLPPGYGKAIMLTLAEDIAPALGVEVALKTEQAAMKARARVHANNRVTPRLVTRDAGLPGGRGYYDFRSGSWR